MSRCECCRGPIPEPVIPTVAGEFLPGWGLCRRCWRLVGRQVRREVIQARLAFKLQPHLEQSVTLYWLWQLAVTEVEFGLGRRAVA